MCAAMRPRCQAHTLHVICRSFTAEEKVKVSQPALDRNKANAGKQADTWDVFISYRVDADKKLVETLYWRLIGTDVKINGTTRKLKVFWDAECLIPGESWEAGFSRAICSSTVVVTVLSRGTLKNVVHLTPESCCDNVLMEFRLALLLAKMKGTTIFPLFVGDKVKDEDGDEVFTHYFKSGCYPKCPDIIVDAIEQKAHQYITEARQTLGLGLEEMTRLTVAQVMGEVTQSQGFFLRGLESNALKDAVHVIHDCVQRLMRERASRKLVDNLQFWTPQGQEVLDWLAKCMLASYAHVFARNQLDSLNKVAELRDQDIDNLNDEFCANAGIDGKTKIGGRVRLAMAVASLKGDGRTKTITDRARDYKDTSVSADMLIGAQNQLEVRVVKSKSGILQTLVLIGLLYAASLFMIPFQGFPLYYKIQSETKPRSVTSYGVQLSANNVNWTDVTHAEGSGGAYVFDSSASAARPGLVVTNLFPHPAEARYIRVLPRSWQGQLGSHEDGNTGGDLRLSIVGSLADGPSLDFTVVLDGLAGQAWLQNGCSGKHDAPPGQWVSKDENAGHVQCCLATPRVHTCTRDGCLSASGGDAVKVNWREAKSRCETRGWRLCSRVELNRKASSGCCGQLEADTPRNLCGYDEEHVWTSTSVDAGWEEEIGRLHSDNAFESVKQVTVDLLSVRQIDGLQIQGGVPDSMAYGATPHAQYGVSCTMWTFVWPIHFFGAVLACVYQLATTTPRAAVQAVWCEWIYNIFVTLTTFYIVATDPLGPSLFSNNPVCKTWGPSVRLLFYSEVVNLIMYLSMCTVHFFRPAWFFRVVNPLSYVCAFAIWWMVYQHTVAKYLVFILVVFLVIAYPREVWRRRRGQQQAQYTLKDDVKKYNAAWSVANASCFKWKDVGSQRPLNGTEIINDALATALKQTLRFRPEEIDEFKIGEVSDDTYIKVGDTYFQPEAKVVVRQGLAASGRSHGRQVHVQDRQPSDPGADDVGFIHNLCSETKIQIQQERDDVVKKWNFFNRFLFNMGAGPRFWQQASRYGRTGKYRQRTQNVDLLFEEAVALNQAFLQLVEDEILGASQSFTGTLVCGPVKRTDRALQKVVRKYYRDIRCLTDLIRCCMVLPSIESVRQCLEVIRSKSVVGALPAHGEEERLMLMAGTMEEAKSEQVFRLVNIKDKFSVYQEDGYRYINLNVEVAWTIASESGDSLEFVSAYDIWDKPDIRTHICEIQLVLDSMYVLKTTGCHENFVEARNLLAK